MIMMFSLSICPAPCITHCNIFLFTCILIFYCFYQIMVNKNDCGNDLTLHHNDAQKPMISTLKSMP